MSTFRKGFQRQEEKKLVTTPSIMMEKDDSKTGSEKSSSERRGREKNTSPFHPREGIAERTIHIMRRRKERCRLQEKKKKK